MINEFYLIYGILLLICARQNTGDENFSTLLAISGFILSIVGIVKVII